MRLPSLNRLSTSREMINKFLGYHHAPVIGENECYEMQNLTSARYPLLSPRGRRGRILEIPDCNGLFAKERLCWVEGTRFYYNGKYFFDVSDTKKQFVSMGAYLLIWPDKLYFNKQTFDYGSLEHEFVTSGTVNVALCKQDGERYENVIVGATAPTDPEAGALWCDTSTVPNTLQQWSESSQMWVLIPTTYLMISAPNIGKGFSQYDAVSFSGFERSELNTSHVLYQVTDDSLVVVGMLDQAFSQEVPVTVSRSIPDLDFVTELGNRIWGCSSKHHAIYASALGDPFNWNRFEGIASDSYAATVGTDGDFTAACGYNGQVLFFKEDCLHKIYGSKPANFQVVQSDVRGVEKGSHASLAVVNDVLYYKSRAGVCAYDGSIPTTVSKPLGEERYSEAVASALGDRYYLSMKGKNGWQLFVLDQQLGLWHREDQTQVKAFARIGNELYFVASDDWLYSVGGSTVLYDLAEREDIVGTLEDAAEWFAETGAIGLNHPDQKYISKLQLRVWMESGAELTLSVRYDTEPEWQQLIRMVSQSERSYTIPILPHRCDHMRLRLSGRGDCRIYSIAKTVEKGSDVQCLC